MDRPETTAPPTTADAVAQAAMAEAELRRLGIEGVRVHHHGDLARLRIPGSSDVTLGAGLLREEILRAVRSAGFRHVAVDLDADEDADGDAEAGD